MSSRVGQPCMLACGNERELSGFPVFHEAEIEMRVDPSESADRSWFQTASSCDGKEASW